jgi:hypothetical protein
LNFTNLTHFEILDGFERLLIFQVGCALFRISGQRLAELSSESRALTAFATLSRMVASDLEIYNIRNNQELCQ